MDSVMLNTDSQEPLYIQLYHFFRTQIEQGRLHPGEKIPSIRGLAKNLSVSKITVEKAYQQLLSEGYIENGNRSRYTVNPLELTVFKPAGPFPTLKPPTSEEAIKKPLHYDFASGDMDSNGFDFSLWKRYINKVFLKKDRLTSYGDAKGEAELRRELARYLQESRGVYAHQEQIIVGAGIQHLLHMLCSLLKTSYQSIAFEEPGFKQGRRVFADNAFSIIPVNMTKGGLDMNELLHSQARLVYLSPSHQFPTGYIMPIGQRNRLLAWAKSNQGTIIEDDYDSEFRYFGRPIPALKGLDSADCVVYLGSLSKVIPPSIRISYMVLPEHLLSLYQKNSSLYNQSASTLEQLALAQFMADGHFARQIRRLRKLYQEKRLLFLAAIREIMAERVKLNEIDAGLHTILGIQSSLSVQELVSRALQKGCRIVPLQEYYLETVPHKLPQVILYFSKIPKDEIKAAIQLLKEAWF